jgi:cytoplasmic iron level regulating protein YaaA (DUF328/UPF0246 family)
MTIPTYTISPVSKINIKELIKNSRKKKDNVYTRINKINKKLIQNNKKVIKSWGDSTSVPKDNNGLDGSYYLKF